MSPVLFPRRTLLVAAGALPFAACSQNAPTQAPTRSLDVPYVPTPMPVVRRMLEVARVRGTDMVYDLGCGDGRIVVTAAQEHGARGVGIDLNPQRISEAQQNAEQAGVTGRTRFMVGDLFEADLSAASVVTLYLLPNINVRLRPQLWRQLATGTRVVSHAFDMGEEWPPERTEQVGNSTIHSWTITAQNKRDAGRG